MPPLLRRAIALGAFVAFLLGHRAQAQTTYTWNYSGTDWNTAANWSPSGVPTGTDTALLTTFDALTYNLPSFSASAAVGQLSVLGPRPLNSATTFTGNGNTLTVGIGGTMTVAPLEYRGGFGTSLNLSNLQVNVATGTTFQSGSYEQTVGAVDFSGFSTRVVLQNGTNLRLIDAAGTTNYDLTINGGAQLIVNAGTVLTNGVGVNSTPQGVIRFHGGGNLNVIGANGVASTFNLNQVSSDSGHASIGVFAGTGTGSSVQLDLGNGTLQSGIDRSMRDSAGTVIGLGSGTVEFNFSSSTIPGFTGSVQKLFLAPGATGVPAQNGVITEGTSSNSNSPYVILTGSIPGRSGVLGRFAAYDALTGAVAAQQGIARDNTNLSLAATNENTVYRPLSSTGADATLANDLALQTIVFEARDTGQSVHLNGHTLTTPGILVERPVLGTGTFTFSVDGGTIAGPASALRNIFVLGASGTTVFNVGATFGSGGGIVKSGTGTMVLTANSDQVNFGGDVIINQGALRARIDGANANFGANNTLALRGGVLEVDANGGTSTFSRSLGAGLGQVNWASATISGDKGSGGFAAFNGNLDINISGDGRTLVWQGKTGGDQSFLRSGQLLRLGSGQAGGVTTLVNGLGLDDGSAGLPFESRQIMVDAPGSSTIGNPAFRSRITGVISGSSSSGLMKSGVGMLELTAANTYAGGTSVDVGSLIVSNTSGSGTGTGRVTVFNTLLGGGTIAPAAGNGLTMMPSSFLFVYRDQLFGTPSNLTVGSAGVNNPVTLRVTSTSVFQLNGATFDPSGGASSYSRLTIRGTGAITLGGSTLTVAVLPGFTPSGSDVFGILDNQTANAIPDTFSGLSEGATVNAFFPDNSPAGSFTITYDGDISGSSISIHGGNDIVLYNFTPVPEPLSVLAMSAAALGLFGLKRRAARRA